MKRIENLKGFIDIKLSLKALRKALENQLRHSKENFLFAWDIGESRLFISHIEVVLKSMKDLFGDTLDNRIMFAEMTYNGSE